MDLLWMVLPVFLVCSAAQNLTEIKAQLGQDITLNCSIDNPSFHWYMEIHSQFRGCIVRVINDNPYQYFVSTSISKYEAINGKRLVIKNITAEDCRLYFCARRQNDEISFEYAFHVVSGVFISPSTNDSQANQLQQQQHIWRIWQNELVVYSSFVLNALLVIICLVFTSLCLKRKNCSYQMNDPSPLPCENPETQEAAQYEEIQLSSCTSVPAGPPSDCIYYKAQLPKSMLPQH